MMTKKEIHDELLRIKVELALHKKDEEKCKVLEEEHQKLRKALANLLIEELQDKEENKKERGTK